MTTNTDKMETILPISAKGLDLLGWFAQWTPEIHKANWAASRSWPPGWRQTFTDVRVSREEAVKDARARLLIPVHHEVAFSLGMDLVSYGLLEGSHGHLRLTPKGRAALKFGGREAPDCFVSHCPEIFDDFNLLPVVNRATDIYDLGTHGTFPPDTKATWQKMLRLYPGGRVHGTSRRASVQMSSITGQNIYLHGSLRKHRRALSMAFTNNAGSLVLEALFSSEQIMDMLTLNCDVPVTLQHYRGLDGMGRSEPCPPPISIGRRMEHRIKATNRKALMGIQEIRDLLIAAKMGKNAKKEILATLGFLESNWPKDTGFAVDQAVEEISSLLESAVTISQEKQAAALESPQDFVSNLLNSGTGETEQ